MDRIRALKAQMSKAEYRHFKAYVKTFIPRSYDKCMKMLKLMDLHPEMSQSELIERLYGNPNNKAYFHLKHQVEEKMLISMCICAGKQTQTAQAESFAHAPQVILHLKLSAAMLLRNKGLKKHSEDLLDGCIIEAEEMGLPEVKLLALVHARSISASKEAVCESMRKEIAETLEQLHSDIMGIGYLDEIRVSLPQPPNPNLIFRLEEITSKLSSQLDTAYSPRAHYYLLFLTLILREARGDSLKSCKDQLKEMITLLNKHAGLKSRNRWGIPYIRLAELEMRSYDFEAAYQAANKAMEILPARKTNSLVAGINKMYACLYLGKTQEARELASSLSWIHQQNPKDIHSGWLWYLQAFALYLEGDYMLARKILPVTSTLMHHKKDWNPILRVVEIQLLIDSELYDIAEARIEALRKHREKYELSDRMEGVFKCLYQLQKYSFDFHASIWESFPSQRIPDARANWEPFSQEIIPFEFWFSAKQQRIPLRNLMLKLLQQAQ